MLGMDISHSGFRIEEQVLSATECDSLLAHLATVSISSGRAGTRHLMSNEAVREIANDGRLLRVAENTLGLSAVRFERRCLQNLEPRIGSFRGIRIRPCPSPLHLSIRNGRHGRRRRAFAMRMHQAGLSRE